MYGFPSLTDPAEETGAGTGLSCPQHLSKGPPGSLQKISEPCVCLDVCVYRCRRMEIITLRLKMSVGKEKHPRPNSLGQRNLKVFLTFPPEVGQLRNKKLNLIRRTVHTGRHLLGHTPHISSICRTVRTSSQSAWWDLGGRRLGSQASSDVPLDKPNPPPLCNHVTRKTPPSTSTQTQLLFNTHLEEGD